MTAPPVNLLRRVHLESSGQVVSPGNTLHLGLGGDLKSLEKPNNAASSLPRALRSASSN